jgi:hypothetical protein
MFGLPYIFKGFINYLYNSVILSRKFINAMADAQKVTKIHPAYHPQQEIAGFPIYMQ